MEDLVFKAKPIWIQLDEWIDAYFSRNRSYPSVVQMTAKDLRQLIQECDYLPELKKEHFLLGTIFKYRYHDVEIQVINENIERKVNE